MRINDDLTPEQEANLDVYAEKWIKIGTKTCDLPSESRLRELIDAIYKTGGLLPPDKIVTFDGPVAALKAIRVTDIDADSYSACDGAHDAGWLSFYAYIREILGLQDETADLWPLITAAQEGVGWFWPYSDVCIVSRLPVELHLSDNGLHKDGGPAIRYLDGTEVWALNDIVFKNDDIKFVRTRAEDLVPAEILAISNADCRAEVIRKYGVEKLVDKLTAKVLETRQARRGENSEVEWFPVGEKVLGDGVLDYAVLEVAFSANYPTRKYLRMPHPKGGHTYVEPLHPDVATVAEAMHYRIYKVVKNEMPLITRLT